MIQIGYGVQARGNALQAKTAIEIRAQSHVGRVPHDLTDVIDGRRNVVDGDSISGIALRPAGA